MRRAVALALLFAGCGPAAATVNGGTPDLAAAPLHGATVAVQDDGSWSVAFDRPAWRFSGKLDAAPTQVTRTDGSDGAGAYTEVAFVWADPSARSGAIRAWRDQPVVLFFQRTPGGGPNSSSFPTMTPDAEPPHHLTWRSQQFSPPSFTDLGPDSPWVFFDDDAQAFVLSAADHFPNAVTRKTPAGALASGIDPAIADLPAGFEHAVVLVAAPSITRALRIWGDALLQRSGKPRLANDATVELERLGYWTDNGASYYYAFDAQKGYTGTLLAVRDQLLALGLPLGYLQLDSWWYPKGADAKWDDRPGGIYRYEAEPTLFPDGLAAFATQLGLPLVTHARWIDPSSPYRTEFTMSNNVVTDPAYWTGVAQSLRGAGVVTYEQDWLDQLALPATSNLSDQDAFLDHMAQAMKDAGLSMQYCMPLPRHHLQSTKYTNLVSIRTAFDRFGPDRWHDHLYVSALDAALGAWPWVDVFFSTETDNLVLATLSGGLVGVGDALGSFDAAALRKVARPDGVLIKPDAPLQPVDASWVAEARGDDVPLEATTFTDAAGVRATYAFAFGPQGQAPPFGAGDWTDSVVLDMVSGTAQRTPGPVVPESPLAGGRGYWVIVPVGQLGQAFLGDADKLVPLGRRRVTALSDDADALRATLAFAAGEAAVTVRIWSPGPPTVTASAGSVSAPRPDPNDARLFLVDVIPDGETASIAIRP